MSHRSLGKQNFSTRHRSKARVFISFNFHSLSFPIAMYGKIKCALPFNMTFTFIITPLPCTTHNISYIHISLSSHYSAPPEYNIKVEGTCTYISVHISSREKPVPSCNAISLTLSRCFPPNRCVRISVPRTIM